MPEQLGSYIHETLAALVRINSINPAFDPAAPGEGPIAEWISRDVPSSGASRCPAESVWPARSKAAAAARH